MNEVMKCPKCGEELEHGFIRAPRGIYWDKMGRKESLISRWSLTVTVPRIEAWKCSKCSLVVFLYKQGVK
jgi:hypothetical protein